MGAETFCRFFAGMVLDEVDGNLCTPADEERTALIESAPQISITATDISERDIGRPLRDLIPRGT